MITFNSPILKFNKKGEKTGWTYIEISKSKANQLNPSTKTSFRVKGRLDQHKIEKLALIPMGEGNFILPLNAKIRKGIEKKEGDLLMVSLELDSRKPLLSSDLMKCLRDDPPALAYFKSLPKSHQLYFSKWIEEAKTIQTKTKRIVMAVSSLGQNHGFQIMMREIKKFDTKL